MADVSVIENDWAFLYEILECWKVPNLDALWAWICWVWPCISMNRDRAQKLSKSVPYRLNALLKVGGNFLKVDDYHLSAGRTVTRLHYDIPQRVEDVYLHLSCDWNTGCSPQCPVLDVNRMMGPAYRYRHTERTLNNPLRSRGKKKTRYGRYWVKVSPSFQASRRYGSCPKPFVAEPIYWANRSITRHTIPLKEPYPLCSSWHFSQFPELQAAFDEYWKEQRPDDYPLLGRLKSTLHLWVHYMCPPAELVLRSAEVWLYLTS